MYVRSTRQVFPRIGGAYVGNMRRCSQGKYRLFPLPSAELSNLHAPDDEAGSSASPFRHGVDLVQRRTHKGYQNRYDRFFSRGAGKKDLTVPALGLFSHPCCWEAVGRATWREGYRLRFAYRTTASAK